MEKDLVAFWKQNYPSLFYKVAGSYPLIRIVIELDRFHYLKAKFFGKPYFGAFMLAGQTWTQRIPHMRHLIEEEIMKKGPENGFRVLEMGSWAGNSAILWADAIREKGVKDGLVVCVDPWESYIRNKECAGKNKASLIMDHVARKGQIFPLFLHNVKASGYNGIIKPFKGFTQDILPMLAPGSFDMVYVDASHLYSGILHDLRWAVKLVCPGGVICGDDLELRKNEIDLAYTEQNKERDLAICPRTGKEYHPGITLAVAEVFGDRITCQDGFWYVHKNS